MVRTFGKVIGVFALVAAIASPASAQVVQSVQVGFGGFFPRQLDTRVQGDVLVENLTTIEPLDFFIDDFRGGEVFGEYLVAFGDRVEFGAGVGYYGRRVDSLYRNLIDQDGSEITQDLRLRVAPVTGVVRFLPFGSAATFQPYVGVGVGAFNYRYSEIGEFVDLFDNSIFEDRFVASGTAIGTVVLGGVRIPIQGDIYGLTLEYRYQRAEGDTGGIDAGFLADRIDLGGGNFTLGFLVRF